MGMVRCLLGLVFLLLVALGLAYYAAGKAAGPHIEIDAGPVVGQQAPLKVVASAPDIDSLTIQIEQGAQTIPVFTLSSPAAAAKVERPEGRLTIATTIGKKDFPQLQPGAAKLVVTAARPVLRGLRHVTSTASTNLQLRFDPPRIAVVSTKHYINLGGSEMVVYRVTPPDVHSGVKVGELVYPGFAASGAVPSLSSGTPRESSGGQAGVQTDPSLKIAFFALLYNQPVNTPIELYARDDAGNEARAQFDHQVFPKKFKSSRIQLDDGFLGRVVPAILQGSPELGARSMPGDLLPAFLKINNDLRRMNAEKIAALEQKTAPQMLWKGAFLPLAGSQVEASFADFRTYIYGGKDVDRQVHLGFDLARVANSPISAANDGRVLYARDLGIYGNCVILDHGMGVQSLYGHMSSFQLQEGQDVRKGQTIGLTGQTGLAGGDHLHFSMLVNGQFVNATEWWDPHWIEDRVMRKLKEAGAPVAP
jgi:murein DD-endopeptidase MepM/ murein hydrolase activator NlpD